MPAITAKMAAELARDAYVLVNSGGVSRAILTLESAYKNRLDVDKDAFLAARTGGPGFIKSRTGFGLVCYGAGAYSGHAFIVMRGTKYLGDWLTNANIGTSRATGGQSVHNGFNTAFQSMLRKLTPFINSLSRKGIHSVHCIGHSLGGALASLAADHIRSTTSLKPYLYTFGAPRVGLRSFADQFSSQLGPERIFRVYHRTDVVPCIPFWPFVHAPTLMAKSYDYFQPSPGDFPGKEWHSRHLYVQTVGTQKWSSLRGRRTQIDDSVSIEHWLNKKESVSFSMTNIHWLDKAINYVITKVTKTVGIALTASFGSAFTLMDRLAYILKKGIDLASTVSSLVMALIRKIMSVLGMKPLVDGLDITTSFVRSLFDRLSRKVTLYCQAAIDAALVSGESV